MKYLELILIKEYVNQSNTDQVVTTQNIDRTNKRNSLLIQTDVKPIILLRGLLVKSDLQKCKFVSNSHI